MQRLGPGPTITCCRPGPSCLARNLPDGPVASYGSFYSSGERASSPRGSLRNWVKSSFSSHNYRWWLSGVYSVKKRTWSLDAQVKYGVRGERSVATESTVRVANGFQRLLWGWKEFSWLDEQHTQVLGGWDDAFIMPATTQE